MMMRRHAIIVKFVQGPIQTGATDANAPVKIEKL
jgi:hypothetical protein